MSPTKNSARTDSKVLIVGAGLLGSSIGLALKQLGVDVIIEDISPAALALAVDYGAGRRFAPSDETDQPGLVVVAVPPESTVPVVAAQLQRFRDAVVTDVASVKLSILEQLRQQGAYMSRYVGSHPMAGREQGGPISARADLFVGATWVIAEHDEATPQAVEAVERLALDVGAIFVPADAATHDESVALVSHVPQLVSTLLAGRLVGGKEFSLSFAGGGLRDTTRIAASDPNLWVQILALNAENVTKILHGLRDDLDKAIGSLAGLADLPAEAPGARKTLFELFEQGNIGVKRIPGKHGRDAVFAKMIVFVDDRPGQLGRLFYDIGETDINIEDLRLEHSPGAEFGLAEISVRPDKSAKLAEELTARGWRISMEHEQ